MHSLCNGKWQSEVRSSSGSKFLWTEQANPSAKYLIVYDDFKLELDAPESNRCMQTPWATSSTKKRETLPSAGSTRTPGCDCPLSSETLVFIG